MGELTDLLTDWTHWAFEIISGGVFFAAGLLVPERFNPVKRLVARHDRNKHPLSTLQPGQWVCPNLRGSTAPHILDFNTSATNYGGVCSTCGTEGVWTNGG